MRISPMTQARLLLLTALYSFLFFPLLPTWAQGEKPQEGAAPSYNVEKGDTLWDIADQELGDPLLWPKLWIGNPALINPDRIYPGDRLRLAPEVVVPMAPAVPIPEAPPPIEEVIPAVPIPEAPPPAVEVTPEVPSEVQPAVVEEPILEKAPPVEKPKAWYQKGWVWTVVGVVIGGIIAAIALQDEDDKEKVPTGSVTVIGPEP